MVDLEASRAGEMVQQAKSLLKYLTSFSEPTVQKVSIHVYVASINKEVINLKKQGMVYGRVGEERKGRKNVIIL